MNIYPSILTDELDLVIDQVEICKESSMVRTVQLDILDGMYADNITVYPSDLSVVDFGNLTIDFHLMTQEPMDFVHEIQDSKDFLPVRAVLGQIEQMSSQLDFLEEVKKNGWIAGLSLNLHTPLESIEDDAWEHLDVIQIMGVQAGFQSQQFNPVCLEIVSELNDIIEEKDLNIEIIVDGGVKMENIEEIDEFGVDGASVGSALWKAENFDDTYQDFLDI